MSKLPLQNIRVLDVTMWQAGPTVTMMLGDMGAEVIKIEAIQHLDGWRGGADLTSNRAYERAPNWCALNRNKLGLTLDLTQSDGAEVFKRIAMVSDVVVDNYTPRVMDNFGLSYDVLSGLNPAIVMISLSGFGATGPWRDFSAFAFPTEEMAGYSQMTGYDDGPPMLIGHPVTDALAGITGAFGIQVALEHRRRTGRGQYIDLSQIEALTGLIGDTVIDYSMNDRLPIRKGNRSASMAPHGVYACLGDDKWIAIAVDSDESWQSLCGVIERPDLAADGRFVTVLGRLKAQADLDRAVEAWTRGRSNHEAMHTLQRAGVPAGAVLTPAALIGDPHLHARGFFAPLDREEVGCHLYPGAMYRLSETPGELRRPAPLLGEHNGYVLDHVLGLSDAEVAELERGGIVGTKPLTQSWR